MSKKILMVAYSLVLVLALGYVVKDMEVQSANHDDFKYIQNEEKPGNNVNKFELVYFELVSNTTSSSGDMYYELAVRDNNDKVKYYRQYSYKFIEHVLKDPEAEPYVLYDKSDKRFHVYKQPMMIYSTDEVEGTVIDKENLEEEDE